jgi:nitrogen regulatory protein PII-like uncharacterized protein
VSYEEIFSIYGDPQDIIKDFIQCLQIIGIKIEINKYKKINELIKEKLNSVMESGCSCEHFD